jgi:hypothetical protein
MKQLPGKRHTLLAGVRKIGGLTYVMTVSPDLLVAVLVYHDGFQVPPLHSHPGSTSHAKKFHLKHLHFMRIKMHALT